jgi:hypothetical protein
MAVPMTDVQTWFDTEIRRFRAAQPSTKGFPSQASLMPRSEIPATVAEARDFFNDSVSDWGAASVHRQTIGARDVLYVHVGTDGDAGWLEVFDATGTFLCAAAIEGNEVEWESREAARERIPARED